jgi:hypothetical protein
MREVWLGTNRRAIWFGTCPPTLIAILGAWLAWRGVDLTPIWTRWLGVALIAIGVVLVVALLTQLRQPRIAFANGELLFYLRSGPPLAVPLEIVEGFFLGQGPSMLASHAPRDETTVNLVARLSERDPQWHDRDVKPALGKWGDGYVTIRGTWCEPLNAEVVRRLNRRLREVTEQRAN